MRFPLPPLAMPANAWMWAALLVLTMGATATPDTARADTLGTTPVAASTVAWASGGWRIPD